MRGAFHNQYTATVLAIQASVSSGESGPIACRCDQLIISTPQRCWRYRQRFRVVNPAQLLALRSTDNLSTITRLSFILALARKCQFTYAGQSNYLQFWPRKARPVARRRGVCRRPQNRDWECLRNGCEAGTRLIAAGLAVPRRLSPDSC